MASADVNLGGDAMTIEVDGTQHAATILQQGGYLYASSGTPYVNFTGGTCQTSDVGSDASIKVGTAVPVYIPRGCKTFSFKAGAQAFLVYVPQRP